MMTTLRRKQCFCYQNKTFRSDLTNYATTHSTFLNGAPFLLMKFRQREGQAYEIREAQSLLGDPSP